MTFVKKFPLAFSRAVAHVVLRFIYVNQRVLTGSQTEGANAEVMPIHVIIGKEKPIFWQEEKWKNDLRERHLGGAAM